MISVEALIENLKKYPSDAFVDFVEHERFDAKGVWVGGEYSPISHVTYDPGIGSVKLSNDGYKVTYNEGSEV